MPVYPNESRIASWHAGGCTLGRTGRTSAMVAVQTHDELRAASIRSFARLDAAGLQAIQTRHRCEVKDATRLMTEAQRDAAVALIVSLIKEKLPELADNGDPLPWDLFRAFTSAAPAGSDAKWGVILIRNKPDSGDALQMTVTQLALPRS